MKKSTPINISQMQNQPKPNNGGPITNNVTKSVSDKNTPEFQRMLDRNLELTRKEKAKRGFSLSNDGVKRGPMDAQQTPTNVDNTETNNEIINNTNVNDNNVENNKSEFQRMLDRNLELTRKEKERRGFSLNNKK